MRKVLSILLLICGTISLGLGIIGIFLPLLPTTPFLLLTAACYVRSSERFYKWLISNKYFGTYILNYRSGKGIPLRAKILGVTLLWISMCYTIFFIIPLLVVKILLFLIGSFFTWIILKQKTLYKNT